MNAPWCLGVLAGGFSRRMGRDKAGIRVHGRTLLEHAAGRYAREGVQVLVGTRPGGPGAASPYQACLDLLPGEGPLSSLAALLDAAGAPWLFALPVDLPLLPADIAERMLVRSEGARAVHLQVGQDPQPFPMLLRTDAVETARRLLLAGERRAMSLLEALAARRLAFDEVCPEEDPGTAFLNVNTPEDLERLRLLLPS